MNKKTLIILVLSVAILLAGVGIAVYFLYSDVPAAEEGPAELAADSRWGLFSAVPADAVALVHFDDLHSLANTFCGDASALGFYRDGAFMAFLSSVDRKISAREISSLKNAGAVLSFHYDGKLVPLLIIDAAKSGNTLPDDFYVVRSAADSAGLFSSALDCSRLADKGTYLEKRNILLISASDVLLKSSERHISQSVSVLDQKGFCEALPSVSGGVGRLYISNDNISKLFAEVFAPEYRRYADFFRRISKWCAFSFDNTSVEHLFMSGTAICGSGHEEFMNVFESTPAASASAAEILPSYTVTAFSLPVADEASSIDAYAKFADTKMGQVKYDASLASLRKRTGLSPEKWAELIDIQEVAVGGFYMGDSFENVLLLRTGKPDLNTLFKDSEVPSMKNYVPAVHDFAFAGFASALFGSLFSVRDETKFTYIDGWVIAGSRAAVEEYASGRALETRLSEYMSGAGLESRTDGRNVHFLSYISITEDSRFIDRVFRRQYAESLKSSFKDVTFAPAVMKLSSVKGKNSFTLTVDRANDVRTRAPVFERDTIVVVPDGPFSVKNSATGKMNTFYQQSNMFLCLNDENGKGLWGVKFGTPICGRAGTIDYFANGKLQILFASGSKLYLIDRLGRFVRPFPVELGKEVLIGPDIYDFNGSRKYNVLVLHKDNTIEMYNLHGKKPAQWKGITSGETIKGLPEQIVSGGKTFWAVRTSVQTLIFPFYGGEPLTVFEGDRKIRPDSPITPVKGGVEATRYDGKKTTIELQ